MRVSSVNRYIVRYTFLTVVAQTLTYRSTSKVTSVFIITTEQLVRNTYALIDT